MLFEVVNEPLVSTAVVFTEMCLLWLSDLIVGRRDSRKASRGAANYSPVSDKREEAAHSDEMISKQTIFLQSYWTQLQLRVTGDRKGS